MAVVVPGLYSPTKEDLKRYQGISLVILTPCGGYDNSVKFTKSVANMISYSWMHGLKVFQMGISERMVVDWARNELARTAKDKINEYTGEKFTHILWLDDDHVFEADLACVLARHGKDMVSALYYARVGKTLPVVYVKDESGEDEYKHFPIIEAPNCIFECDAVGFGAMLMRRDVFDRVPQPWFTLDWQAGEDIAFCVKAKKHGIRIWCDGQYKIGHVGVPKVVGHQDYVEYLNDNKDEFQNKVRINLGEQHGKE
jgi:GT2 family glycosyltransferase